MSRHVHGPQDPNPQDPSPQDPTDQPPTDQAQREPKPPASGLERLQSSFFAPSRGQVVVAVLVGVLAFAAVTQARLTGTNDTYAGLRQSELIQTLNGLQAASRKAERDIAELEATRDRLRSSTQRRTAALEQASREIQTLGVLAGTVPASGPGIRVTVEDPDGDLTLNNLLDGVEELRNAGVEAIEINDRVRVIAQTSFEDVPGGIRVDGVVLKPPYMIDAIGNSDTLAGALQFQGGFSDDVARDSGSVTVKKRDNIEVTVTRKAPEPRYAEPVPGQ